MRKKLTLKRILRVAFFLGLLLAAVNVITETAGLPRFVIRMLERKFAAKGVVVSIGDARAGFINGIHLDDLVCYDAELEDYPILSVQRAHTPVRLMSLLLGRDDAFSFTLESGSLHLPLNDPKSDEPVAIDLAIDEIKVFLGSHRLLEVGVGGRLFSTIGIDCEFSGELPPTDDTAPDPFTMTAYFDQIPSQLIHTVQLLEGIAAACTSSSVVSVTNKLRGDLSQPESLKMNGSVRINSVLFRGVMIEQLEFSAKVDENQAAITNFRYQAGEKENCHGHATMDVKTREFACELEGALYPRNLLRTFYPDGLAWVKDLSFRGAPPRFKVSIPGYKIDNPMDLAGTLFADCRNMVYREGVIQSLYGTFGISKGTVRTTNLQVRINSNVDVFAKGTADLVNGTLFLEANQMGDPMSLLGLCPWEDVSKGLADGFRGFEFSPLARPRFDVEVVYVSGDEPIVVITGTMQGKALRYNGVLYDSVDASVLVDVTGEQIVIDSADLVCNGSPAMTQIVIGLTRDKEVLAFDAMSNLDSKSLMRTIWPEWENILQEGGLTFLTTPFAVGSGFVELDEKATHEINIQVIAPNVRFFELLGNTVEADLTLRNPKITGSGRIKTAAIEGVTFDTVSVKNFILVDDAVDLDLDAEKTRINTATFSNARGHLKWRPNMPLTIDSMGIETVNLDGDSDVKSSLHNVHDATLLVHDDGRIIAKGQAKNALQQMSRSGKTIVESSDLTFSNLAFEKGQLIVQGTTKKFDYAPMKASAKNGRFNAYVKNDVISTTLNVPQLTLENGATLSDVEVITSTKAGKTDAGFQIGALKRMDVIAKNLSGKVAQSGDAYKVTDGRCELLRSSPIELTNLKASALSAFNTITISLNDGTLAIMPKRAVDTKGKKRHPIVINEIKSDMVYKDKVLNIAKFKAPFYGGILEARARADIDKESTETAITLVGIKIRDLLSRGQTEAEKAESKVDGLLSATAGLRLDYSDELQISGLGSAKVRNATLYKVPILSDFLSLLKTKAGKVSKLDCDLQFKGDRVDIVKLETDGRLVSIDASGHYWWKTEGIDMRFQADILSTWVFQKLLKKRLYGTLNKYKWEDWTAVYDMFRRNNEPKDPALTDEFKLKETPKSPEGQEKKEDEEKKVE